MDVWVDGCMYEWTDVWMVGWLHERVGCCQSRAQTLSAGFEKCGWELLPVASQLLMASFAKQEARSGAFLESSQKRHRALGSFGLRQRSARSAKIILWRTP